MKIEKDVEKVDEEIAYIENLIEEECKKLDTAKIEEDKMKQKADEVI